MFRNAIIGIAGFALACSPLAASEKKEVTDMQIQLASGGGNCPVYYGCPAPAPAPKGGKSGSGGSKSNDPSQTPAVLASGRDNCPVYYGCPAPVPVPDGGNPNGGHKGGADDP